MNAVIGKLRIMMSRAAMLAVIIGTPIFVSGCDGNGTTFGEAFSSLGDAFSNWFDTVF